MLAQSFEFLRVQQRHDEVHRKRERERQPDGVDERHRRTSRVATATRYTSHVVAINASVTASTSNSMTGSPNETSETSLGKRV